MKYAEADTATDAASHVNTMTGAAWSDANCATFDAEKVGIEVATYFAADNATYAVMDIDVWWAMGQDLKGCG